MIVVVVVLGFGVEVVVALVDVVVDVDVEVLEDARLVEVVDGLGMHVSGPVGSGATPLLMAQVTVTALFGV